MFEWENVKQESSKYQSASVWSDGACLFKKSYQSQNKEFYIKYVAFLYVFLIYV